MEQRCHRIAIAKNVETTDDTTLTAVENITSRERKSKTLSHADIQTILRHFTSTMIDIGGISPAKLHGNLNDCIAQYLMEQDLVPDPDAFPLIRMTQATGIQDGMLI